MISKNIGGIVVLPIQVIYTENGQPKGSLAEHKRRVEILEHNQELNKKYPVYTNNLNNKNKKAAH